MPAAFQRISPLRPLALGMGAVAETIAARVTGERTPWSLSFEVVFRVLRRDFRDLWRYPPPAIRAHLERLARPTRATRAVVREPACVGGVPGEWFRPRAGSKTDALLVYFHGGSYIFGSTNTHADTIARFALAMDARVFAPNYRLAPEHPFPAQLDDARAVWRALLAAGEQPGRIAIAGESAGGNLVLALSLALRDAGEPLPAGAIPISPWLDLADDHVGARNRDADYGTAEMLAFQARQFAGDAPLDDPRISPMHANLAGLPPLFLQYGARELLADQCERFITRARAAGVPVEVDALPGMPHAASNIALAGGEGPKAIERASAFALARIALMR